MPDRCRFMIKYLSQVSGAEVVVRTHATTVYASHFRFDKTLLINQHAFSAREAQSPVYRIRPSAGSQLFDFYVNAFDRIWTGASDVSQAIQEGLAPIIGK